MDSGTELVQLEFVVLPVELLLAVGNSAHCSWETKEFMVILSDYDEQRNLRTCPCVCVGTPACLAGFLSCTLSCFPIFLAAWGSVAENGDLLASVNTFILFP